MNLLLAGMLLLAALGPVAPGREAATQPEQRVLYAAATDELLFEQVGPAGRGKLVIELPWAGTTREVAAYYADGVWRARWDVAALPVWTEIRYTWQIAPEQGEVLWSPGVTARPDPASTAREWRHTPGDLVDVYTTGYNADAATQIAAAADAGYRRARERLGDLAYQTAARPRVVVVQSELAYMMLTDRGGAGYADSAHGVTLQWRGGYTLDELCAITIPHELFHLVDPTAARPDVPAWFTEGLAVQNEVGFAWAEAKLQEARRSRVWIPGEWMAEYPRADMDEILWYAQAWSMVERLSADQVDGLLAALVLRGEQFLPAWRVVVGEESEAWMGGYMQAQMRRVWPRWVLAGVALAALGCVVAWGRHSRINGMRGWA